MLVPQISRCFQTSYHSKLHIYKMQQHYPASLHTDYMKNSVWKLFNSLEHYPKTQGNNNTFLYSKLSFNNKLNKETKIHMGHWTISGWWVELNRCSLILLPSAQSSTLWSQTTCSSSQHLGCTENWGFLAYSPFGVPEAHWEQVMSVNTLTFKAVTLSAGREQRLLTPVRHVGCQWKKQFVAWHCKWGWSQGLLGQLWGLQTETLNPLPAHIQKY